MQWIACLVELVWCFICRNYKTQENAFVTLKFFSHFHSLSTVILNQFMLISVSWKKTVWIRNNSNKKKISRTDCSFFMACLCSCRQWQENCSYRNCSQSCSVLCGWVTNGSRLLAVGSECAEAVPEWPHRAVCPFCSAKWAREDFFLEANPNVGEPLAVQCTYEFRDQAHSSKEPCV